MRIASHGVLDWCHICGKRDNPLADVWYPENAEHDTKDTKYIRICVVCANMIAVSTERGSVLAGLEGTDLSAAWLLWQVETAKVEQSRSSNDRT